MIGLERLAVGRPPHDKRNEPPPQEYVQAVTGEEKVFTEPPSLAVPRNPLGMGAGEALDYLHPDDDSSNVDLVSGACSRPNDCHEAKIFSLSSRTPSGFKKRVVNSFRRSNGTQGAADADQHD